MKTHTQLFRWFTLLKLFAEFWPADWKKRHLPRHGRNWLTLLFLLICGEMWPAESSGRRPRSVVPLLTVMQSLKRSLSWNFCISEEQNFRFTDRKILTSYTSFSSRILFIFSASVISWTILRSEFLFQVIQ